MLTDYVIRLGCLEDLPQIETLYQEIVVALHHEGIDQWDEIYPSRAVIEEDLIRREMFVFFCEQPLAAMTLSTYQDKEYLNVNWTYRQGRVLVLHRLCVSPAYWGQGIAGLMMDFAERWGMVQGFSALRLDAFTANPRSLGLYHGRGYRLAGQILFRKGLFNCYEKKLEE